MKKLIKFLGSNNGTYKTPFGTFNLKDDLVELVIDNGFAITSDDVWELIDFLYKHRGTEFRICDICGKPYDAGYMHDNGFYACSEECVKKDADERYGKDNWKWIDEWTEEEKERFQSDINIGCLIYKDRDGNWELDNTFYTEW